MEWQPISTKPTDDRRRPVIVSDGETRWFDHTDLHALIKWADGGKFREPKWWIELPPLPSE